ncbi:hypothetical protein GCM10027346_12510 [Hymenobacter seoulensis]
MLHSFLFAPFEDSARQAQYQAVLAALEAEPTAFPTILLGNFEVEGEVVDALLVRPGSITVLLFVPQGGLLDIPDQEAGAWHLGSYTLHGDEHAANPFEQFLNQQDAVASWLSGQLAPAFVHPEDVTGLVLFAGAVQFSPRVESYLRRKPGAENFQLVSHLTQLNRRLRQLSNSSLNLSPPALTAWAVSISTSSSPNASSHALDDNPTGGYWEQKARQLWSWLGAGDIPHDAPYGSAAEAVAASQQELQRLEQLSQQVRTELAQQRQQMEAREAERERSIEELRAKLNQAPSAAAEVAGLQARLAAETQEKNQLEEAIRATQAESAARNQELDARIRQLGQLIEQLQSAPAPGALPAAAPVTRAPASPNPTQPVPSAPAPSVVRSAAGNLIRRPSWRLQWPRAVMVLGVALAVLGGAIWGTVQLSEKWRERPSRPKTEKSAADEDQPAASATAPSLSDIQPDTLVVSSDSTPPEPEDAEATSSSSEENLTSDEQAPDSAQILAPTAAPVEPDSVPSTSEQPTP